MPAFGARLDETQIRLLAAWLKAGAQETLEPDQDAGERLGLENRRSAGDDATDALAVVRPAEEGAVGVDQRQVAARLEPDGGVLRERDLEPECHRSGKLRAVVGVGPGRREARGADARGEIRLRVLPAAEGQGAADVQVLDVRVEVSTPLSTSVAWREYQSW